MRFLRKISPSPYADSMHNVMAYSGEEGEDQTEQEESDFKLPMPTVEVDTTGTADAEQLALERSFEVYQRNRRIEETHKDAINTVGSNMVAAAVGAGLGGGGPYGALAAAGISGAVATYQSCYVSCHDESPPKEP